MVDTFDITPSGGGDKPRTMSSLEIAELTGKRHDNVMADIKTMLEGLGMPALTFQGCYKGKNGKELPLYHLPRRECLILVSGYSVELRARIIDRWEQLEAEKAAVPALDLDSPATLKALLLSNLDKVIALEEKVAIMTPKAEALARLSEADGSVCFTDAAKTLQQRPKLLIQKMRTGWIYARQGGGYVAYQDKIQKGLLEHKTTTVTRPDGSEKIVTQVRVTPKGLVKLAEELGLN